MSPASRFRSISFALIGVVAAACKGPSGPPSISISTGSGKADDPNGASLELLAGQLGAKGSADGVADAARFQGPTSLARYGSSLFAVDLQNRLIRRIDLATGNVSAFPKAASSSADSSSPDQLSRPSELASDGAGGIVVIDDQTSIRRISIETEAIETLAQIPPLSAGASCSRRDALFLAATPTSVYLSDRCSFVVRRFDLSTGAWSVLAGAVSVPGTGDGDAGTARFSRLQGIAMDPAGALWVVDAGRLRGIDPLSGLVTTIGGAASDNGSAMHLALVGPKTAVISDSGASTLSRIDLVTGERRALAGVAGQSGNVDGDATRARFSSPAGLASDGQGQLYIADSSNNSVRGLSLDSGLVSTLAGRGQQSGSTDGDKGEARFRSPEAITTDRSGNLYVADSMNHSIRRIDASSGAVTTVAGAAGRAGSSDGPGGEAGFNHPGGIAVDAEHLYVSDTNNQTIREVALKTGAVTTIAGQVGVAGSADGVGGVALFRRPKGLALEGGRLYVADAENNLIREIDLKSGTVSTLAGLATVGGTADGVRGEARFFWPLGLHGDGHGNLYVADSYNRLIRKIELSSGQVSTLAGAPGAKGPWSADGVGAEARFNYPVDVVPDSSGHLYIADLGNSTVRMLTLASGQVSTVVGSPGQAGVQLGAGTGGLNWPASLTAGADGALVILDQRENAVLRLR